MKIEQVEKATSRFPRDILIYRRHCTFKANRAKAKLTNCKKETCNVAYCVLLLHLVERASGVTGIWS